MTLGSLLLEDGSGELLLEDGSALLLEYLSGCIGSGTSESVTQETGYGVVGAVGSGASETLAQRRGVVSWAAVRDPGCGGGHQREDAVTARSGLSVPVTPSSSKRLLPPPAMRPSVSSAAALAPLSHRRPAIGRIGQYVYGEGGYGEGEYGGVLHGMFGSGASASINQETGYGTVGATASGTATKTGFNVYTKAGYATAGLVGSGPSASVNQETGAGIAGTVAAGVSASVHTRNRLRQGRHRRLRRLRPRRRPRQGWLWRGRACRLRSQRLGHPRNRRRHHRARRRRHLHLGHAGSGPRCRRARWFRLERQRPAGSRTRCRRTGRCRCQRLRRPGERRRCCRCRRLRCQRQCVREERRRHRRCDRCRVERQRPRRARHRCCRHRRLRLDRDRDRLHQERLRDRGNSGCRRSDPRAPTHRLRQRSARSPRGTRIRVITTQGYAVLELVGSGSRNVELNLTGYATVGADGYGIEEHFVFLTMLEPIETGHIGRDGCRHDRRASIWEHRGRVWRVAAIHGENGAYRGHRRRSVEETEEDRCSYDDRRHARGLPARPRYDGEPWTDAGSRKQHVDGAVDDAGVGAAGAGRRRPGEPRLPQLHHRPWHRRRTCGTGSCSSTPTSRRGCRRSRCRTSRTSSRCTRPRRSWPVF